jgi:tRNA U34 5-methylaminomethyl-2-thiouridine-forming methyltransferase MnmC
MNPQLIITKDGSHTLYLEELDETYHSRQGSIQESQYVFIQQGLEYIFSNKKNITLVEVGFGTGLNTWLTYLAICNRLDVNINYIAIEPFPLSMPIIHQLNFPDQFENKNYSQLFYQLHEADWNQPIKLNSHFIFQKIKTSWLDYKADQKIDLVYYDAFAPSKQPEMWERKNFEKVKKQLNIDGCLVTYCAQGIFKRTLKELDFKIEILPGPPGKREMVRAYL